MQPEIVAVVTLHDQVVGGHAPTFYVQSEEEQQELAFTLEKIMNAAAHNLKNGVFVLVSRQKK